MATQNMFTVAAITLHWGYVPILKILFSSFSSLLFW